MEVSSAMPFTGGYANRVIIPIFSVELPKGVNEELLKREIYVTVTNEVIAVERRQVHLHLGVTGEFT